MTTNLESLKAEYLSEFNRSIPRLKELAKVLRAETNPLPGEWDVDSFWKMTPDRRKNYELYQLANDLEAMNEFWDSHPDNDSDSPNDHHGDRSESLHSNLKTSSGLLMDKLFKIEALLKLIEGSMSDSEDSSAIRLAVELVENALDFTDTQIDSPLSRI